MIAAEATPHAGQPGNILVAEDDAVVRDALVGWLLGAGFSVTACSNGPDFLGTLERSILDRELPGFDVIVSDARMQHGCVLDVLDEFVGCEDVPPAILISAMEDSEVQSITDELGIAAVLRMPIDRDRVLAEVERLRSLNSGSVLPAADMQP